ncbi:hypothetical protein EJ02DRAFT_452004 [Clathrospora elynae]|uniref:Uncharacterized protein n=1 Tax=Clathrospora elynae TaxID=706981 RepID=A0A6A5T780_9PLEO|nr:hypothetical protein EJ02DRAFT_452004 [Clathrospora elynae]
MSPPSAHPAVPVSHSRVPSALHLLLIIIALAIDAAAGTVALDDFLDSYGNCALLSPWINTISLAIASAPAPSPPPTSHRSQRSAPVNSQHRTP